MMEKRNFLFIVSYLLSVPFLLQAQEVTPGSETVQAQIPTTVQMGVQQAQDQATPQVQQPSRGARGQLQQGGQQQDSQQGFGNFLQKKRIRGSQSKQSSQQGSRQGSQQGGIEQPPGQQRAPGLQQAPGLQDQGGVPSGQQQRQQRGGTGDLQQSSQGSQQGNKLKQGGNKLKQGGNKLKQGGNKLKQGGQLQQGGVQQQMPGIQNMEVPPGQGGIQGTEPVNLGARVFQNKEEKADKKEEKLQERAEQQAQVEARRKERVRAYFEKMFERLDAAIVRLEKLAERIDSRISKFDKRDVNAEKAKQLLTEARALIENAKTSLSSAKSSVEEILSGENSKEVFARARENVQSVVSHTKDAHKALVQSIVALKGKNPPQEDNDKGRADKESVTDE